MATLQVLCPNGRRQNVKITPNSKLLQVLEEVCQKQGYLPTENYKLIHGRTDLDLSLPMRFSNLPNNAKLELHKLEQSRSEENVMIALQLESGERLQQAFPPTTNLWDILLHWENQAEYKGKLACIDNSVTPPVHPVCIYMRDEIIGELALGSTTLRKLGLTGGKAVIRLIYRPVEDAAIAEIINKLERDKVKEARLSEIASRKHAEMLESEKSTATMSVDDCPKASAGSSNISMAPEARQESMMDAQTSKATEVMEIDSSDSSMSWSNSNRPGRPRSTAEQSAVEQLRSMNIPGLDIFTPDDFNQLSQQQQQVARGLAQRMMHHLIGTPLTPTQSSATPQLPMRPTPSTQQFIDFKFPEATKGQNLYKNELSEVKPEMYLPCERETLLYQVEEVTSDTNLSEDSISDDFFELCESDIQTMMSDLHKNVEAASEMPLMTNAMRIAQLEERYGVYEVVVIRIQFPEKLVLQGIFKPRETIFSVQQFVREHLEDKSTSFYLYTSPPKCVLADKTTTLIEAHLVPATRIYFGCDDQKEFYLSSAVRAEISPRAKAEEIAHNSLPKITEEVDPATSTKGKMSKGKGPSSSGYSTASGSGLGKVPKWMKLSKK